MVLYFSLNDEVPKRLSLRERMLLKEANMGQANSPLSFSSSKGINKEPTILQNAVKSQLNGAEKNLKNVEDEKKRNESNNNQVKHNHLN